MSWASCSSDHQKHCLKTPHISNLSTLAQPIDRIWEVTLRLPSWLLAFFGISWGLYISLKLRLWAYHPGVLRNQIILQVENFRQAIPWLNLLNNLIATGRLIIVYYWPNIEEKSQGIIHILPKVILDTTAPNTPQNKTKMPLQYNQVSPPPPQLEAFEASARNTAPSETSEDTLF